MAAAGHISLMVFVHYINLQKRVYDVSTIYIYAHTYINSNQGGVLVWNYVVGTSCHTRLCQVPHIKLASWHGDTHVAPFGFQPWTCFYSVYAYIYMGMCVDLSWMRPDVTGTHWFVQSFCLCSFVERICMYIYLCICFQEKYLHVFMYQGMYLGFSVEFTTMHVEINMPDRSGAFDWDLEVCQGFLPGWHRGRAVRLPVPSFESALESRPQKIGVLVIYVMLGFCSSIYVYGGLFCVISALPFKP